jgi:protein phosphatase
MELPAVPEQPRRITRETFNLEDGPIDLALYDHSLRIVDAARDLTPDQCGDLNTRIGCFVVDPAALNVREGTGYKAVRDGESIIFGRGHTYGRFDFGAQVSGEHVRVSRAGDEIVVRDMNSLNGTFIGGPAPGTSAEASQGKSDDRPTFRRSSFTIASHSAASANHPGRNEDAVFIDRRRPAIGVLDGVSTASGSDLAARIGARSIQESLQESRLILPVELGLVAVKAALQTAHRTIRRTAPGSGMSATATVAKIFETSAGKPYAAVASVADTRAYLLRQNRLSFLTLDEAYDLDSAPDDELAMQDKLARVTDYDELNAVQGAAFRTRHYITHALGGGSDPVVTGTHVMLEPGDRLLLTTDGVHDNLTTQEMEALAERTRSDHRLPRDLVSAARDRSRDTSHMRYKVDDMTAAVLSFHG